MIIEPRFYVRVLCSFSSETLFACVYKLMLTDVKVFENVIEERLAVLGIFDAQKA